MSRGRKEMVFPVTLEGMEWILQESIPGLIGDFKLRHVEFDRKLGRVNFFVEHAEFPAHVESEELSRENVTSRYELRRSKPQESVESDWT